MSEENIVFIDVPTPEARKVIEDNLPPGFRLIFAEADTEEKALSRHLRRGEYGEPEWTSSLRSPCRPTILFSRFPTWW